MTQRSLMFDGVKLYNDVPIEIRRIDNLNVFKRYCMELVKDGDEDQLTS